MAGLRVEVRGGEIVVTLPGTSYTVTYYKPAKSPQLLAKRIASRDDPGSAMTLSEFLARAWRAANDKARELGWIGETSGEGAERVRTLASRVLGPFDKRLSKLEPRTSPLTHRQLDQCHR